MAAEKGRLEELISSLKQQRDELAVRIHLSTQEAKQEWNQLNDKLEQLFRDFEPVRDAAGESAKDIWQSLKLTAHEIKEGFERIRKSL